MVIALVPQHAKTIKPPRALLVPFELGRPLGAPEDAQFQLKVLTALLGLLQAEQPGSYLESFEEDAPDDAQSSDAANAGWACPVSFPPANSEDTAGAIRQEVDSLKPWFERAKQRRGRTGTGTSGLDTNQALTLLIDLAKDKAGAVETYLDNAGLQQADRAPALGDLFKLAAEDLKLYYAEAAMEQQNPGSSKEVQNWFWNDTHAGALLFQLAEHCAQHADALVKTHARFTLVPAQRLAQYRSKKAG